MYTNYRLNYNLPVILLYGKGARKKEPVYDYDYVATCLARG